MNSEMPSPLALLESPVPCAQCRQRVPGLRWGDLCADCTAQLRRRASPLARRISLLAALLVIGYAWLRIPLRTSSRVWVAAIAIATYFLVRKIATQVAMDLMKREIRDPEGPTS